MVELGRVGISWNWCRSEGERGVVLVQVRREISVHPFYRCGAEGGSWAALWCELILPPMVAL